MFLNSDDIKLSDLCSLNNELIKKHRERKDTYGVYCIFNANSNEILYVGKSKTVLKRVRQQLIGSKNRNTGLQRYTRLFLGVILKENGIEEKKYNNMTNDEKKAQIKLYNKKIFTPNNYLKVCFTKDHVDALVLEATLINYYSKENQCKYNVDKMV